MVFLHRLLPSYSTPQTSVNTTVYYGLQTIAGTVAQEQQHLCYTMAESLVFIIKCLW